MLKSIAISLSLTTLISTGFSSAAYFFHISFWGVFIITFLIQVIFFYIYNGFIQNKNLLKQEQIENDRIAELSKQGTMVTCAFCHKPSFTLLRFDADNILFCEKCGKTSSLYITVESAQVTIPVSNIKAAELPQEVVDDLAKIALSETSKTKN